MHGGGLKGHGQLNFLVMRFLFVEGKQQESVIEEITEGGVDGQNMMGFNVKLNVANPEGIRMFVDDPLVVLY